MKPATSALQALLASNQFSLADLYTFTLVGGGVLRYTSYDTDIVFAGNSYASGGQAGPFFDRRDSKARCHWKIGVAVDTLVFDVVPGSATVNGAPFLSAARQGVFDGAELELDRAFMATTGEGVLPPLAIPAATGIVTLFAGRVAEIDAGRSIATFNISSHLELLNLGLPRDIYQPGCLNTLFDAACTLNPANFAVGGMAAAGSSASLVTAAMSQPTGYFDLGKLVFTGGVNAGLSRSVKTYLAGNPASFALLSPLPSAPQPGDAFTAYPGCDKTQATCTAKFANLANFRGFPYVPAPETAV